MSNGRSLPKWIWIIPISVAAPLAALAGVFVFVGLNSLTYRSTTQGIVVDSGPPVVYEYEVKQDGETHVLRGIGGRDFLLQPTQEEARRNHPVGSEIDVYYFFDNLQAYSSTAERGTSWAAIFIFVVGGCVTYFSWRRYRNDLSTVQYNGPAVSLAMCSTAFVIFVTAIALDGSVRQEQFDATTVRRGAAAIALTMLTVVSTVGWLAGGLVAIASLVARSSRPLFAWLALAVNAIGAGILACLK